MPISQSVHMKGLLLHRNSPRLSKPYKPFLPRAASQWHRRWNNFCCACSTTPASRTAGQLPTRLMATLLPPETLLYINLACAYWQWLRWMHIAQANHIRIRMVDDQWSGLLAVGPSPKWLQNLNKTTNLNFATRAVWMSWQVLLLQTCCYLNQT